MSDKVGISWDGLAGLMDIPYEEQEKIRFSLEHLAFVSKAQKIFLLYNAQKSFDRCSLQQYFEELKRLDLKKEMLKFKTQYEVSVIIRNFLFLYSTKHSGLMGRFRPLSH